MEFRPLLSFVEVVRKGGFTQAAKAVLTTQSAVSKAIRQLEEELGTPLLARGGHRPILTPAGEVVYRRATKLLADREAMLVELDEVRGLARGTLRIGLSPIFCDAAVAGLLTRFHETHPEIMISVFERHSEQLVVDLRQGDIDVALILEPNSADDLCYRPLARQRFSVLLPQSHLLARRESLSLSDIKNLPFVMFDNDSSAERIIRRACSRFDFEPETVARACQLGFIKQLVEGNVGVALVPEVTARQLDNAVGQLLCIPIREEEISLPFGLAHQQRVHFSPAASAWANLVRDHYSVTEVERVRSEPIVERFETLA